MTMCSRSDQAQVLTRGGDVALFASGMMLAARAGRGHRCSAEHGVAVSVVNVPVIKPLDAATVTEPWPGPRGSC